VEANGPRFRWIGLAEDGSSVVLRRFEGEFSPPEYVTEEWLAAHPDQWRRGVVLDVETTGTSPVNDRITEIGIRCFRFHRETGEILTRDEGYGALEDPGIPLSPEIVRITGITDEMVKGKRIDWPKVQSLLEQAQIVIAHNASFDRPFLDRYLPLSSSKIWGCSFRQIDWPTKGFPSQKLEILAIYHGFFCTAHRALADADTLLHLLAMRCPIDGTPYLGELLRNARRKSAIVLAVQSPRKTKDLLKQRGYRWDGERKVWNKLIYHDETPQEVAWLTEHVYAGHFQGIVRELSLSDGFKPLSVLFGPGGT